MNIVRIEHSNVLRDGRPAGPYSEEAVREAEHEEPYCDNDEGDCIHDFCCSIAWQSGAKTPTPGNDGLGYDISPEYLFCFTSVDKMRDWFNGHMTKLEEYGFVAAVYSVEETYTKHGFKQSVFEYRPAKRIGDCKVTNYRAIQKMMNNASI